MEHNHHDHHGMPHDMTTGSAHDMTDYYNVSGHEGHDMSVAVVHSVHETHPPAGHATFVADNTHFMHVGGAPGGHGDGVLQAGVEEVLLFVGAVTSSAGTLVFACIVLLLFAVLLEFLRLLAWWLESYYVKCYGGSRDDNDVMGTCEVSSITSKGPGACGNTSGLIAGGEQTSCDAVTNLNNANGTVNCSGRTRPPLYRSWLSLSQLWLLNTIIGVFGTCMMLITMTFNVYIIVSIAAGTALGKLATMYTKTKLVAWSSK